MPRILEMKTINNELWVRVGYMTGDSGTVTLYTEQEIKMLKLATLGRFHEELLEFSRNYQP